MALRAIALAVRHRVRTLAAEQRAALKSTYLAAKQGELQLYVSLGTRSNTKLYDAPWQDAETQEQAKAILAKRKYGDESYFFIYGLKGVNLMRPRQPNLAERNLRALTDAVGNHTIQKLTASAQAGGGVDRDQWGKTRDRQNSGETGVRDAAGAPKLVA